jgi:cell wall-associated NlpC family hydrolase
MRTVRRYGRVSIQRLRPWWRPLSMSAVAMAAIAALFAPLPASAAPGLPAAPGVPAAPQVPSVPLQPAVPDSGSRPIALGTLVMPGQVATAAATATPGVSTSPVQAQRDKMQAEIAALGDQLIQLQQDKELATTAQTAAAQKVTDAQALLSQAQTEAATAAAASLRDAAAMPPGTFGSDLQGLGALAQLQQGDTASEQSAARHVTLAQAAMTAATTEQTGAAQRVLDLGSQYTTLQTQIATKQAALTKYESSHAKELSLADATENAQDAALGKLYLQGAGQGRGADARAIAAVKVAITKIGRPYVWSAEGPNYFDCSGLMYYSYHSAAAGDYPLARVSRDQYWQTHAKVVDRYSLLPGDLLFFSYSNSWTDIHHVAMYAGNGMMIEAPRTGLNVRLTPVRWTRLFQATRVYGSVDGVVQGPDLSHVPTSGNDSGTGNGASPSPSATTKPPTSTPTKPSTGPTTPSTGPTTPSTGPTTPSTGPSTPSTPAAPATTAPATGSTGDTSTPTGTGSSGGSETTAPSDSGTSSGSSSPATASSSSSSSSQSSSASASSSSSGEPK